MYFFLLDSYCPFLEKMFNSALKKIKKKKIKIPPKQNPTLKYVKQSKTRKLFMQYS